MTSHRYPARETVLDYARAGTGLALTAGPVALVPTTPAVGWTLGAVAVLFAVFAMRTARRQATEIRLEDDALRAIGPFGATVAWGAIEAFSLRFYPTKRDRSRGWMQLKVKGGGSSISIESSLAGFDTIVRAAWAAARANGVAVSETTRANLGAYGLAAGDPVHQPGWAKAS